MITNFTSYMSSRWWLQKINHRDYDSECYNIDVFEMMITEDISTRMLQHRCIWDDEYKSYIWDLPAGATALVEPIKEV